jgi:hypothetical protein
VPSNGGTELVIVESHLGEAKGVGGMEHKLSSAVAVLALHGSGGVRTLGSSHLCAVSMGRRHSAIRN